MKYFVSVGRNTFSQVTIEVEATDEEHAGILAENRAHEFTFHPVTVEHSALQVMTEDEYKQAQGIVEGVKG